METLKREQYGPIAVKSGRLGALLDAARVILEDSNDETLSRIVAEAQSVASQLDTLMHAYHESR